MKGTTIAKIIKDLRISRNLTQKQLAEKTGLSYSSIVGYENGLREPNSKAMAILERFFQVSGDFLRGNIDKTTFIENNETVQNGLDSLIDKFQKYKIEFNSSSQHNQLLSVSILDIVLDTVTVDLLHNNACPDLTSDEVQTIFSALVQLTASNRNELTKRAEELLLIQQYRK